MKRLLLLSLMVINVPAVQMPPKPPMASLKGLPAELKQLILLHIGIDGGVLNISALAQGLTTLAATSKDLHAAINNPVNMLTILKSLPKAGAVVLAEGLRKMPGMKSDEVKEWLKSTKDKLENGQELFEAVSSDNADPAIVADILKNPNVNVNWMNRDGATALGLASGAGVPTEIVKLLINAGANVNLRKGLTWTPLMIAADDRNIDKVKLLLEAGADINATDKNGGTALMIATIESSAEIVSLLLAAGANVNKVAKYGWTPLLKASDKGHPELVRILLAAGADPFALLKDMQSKIKSARDIAQQHAQYHPEFANDYNAVIKLLEDAEKAQKDKAARK